jgi:hypothetical protein
VLDRLVNKHENVYLISKDFDDDVPFISGIVDFVIAIGWMRQNKNGDYKMTRKGRTNTIETKSN